MHGLRTGNTFLILDDITLRIDEEDRRNPILRMDLTLRTLLAEELMPMTEITRSLADTSEAEGATEPGGSGRF